jgi:threonine dehydrogenase-like Zn-dependent dehydrogenase
MRAVRNTEQGIRVAEVAPPVAPGGVRVSVAGSGICGSDLHLVAFGPSSVTLGHEFGGRLDDGTPVAVVPVLTCGHCDPCRSGDEQRCGEAFGGLYGMSLDGGMADEVWVDPRCTRVVPEEVPVEDACLVEPLAVALHGVDRAGVEPGMRVLIIGAGPIGLCTVAVARHRGATVDLSARHQNRLSAGERLGAGTALGTDYDVVLDAAGTQSSVEQAVALTRPGGTVGILANFWDPVSLSMAFLIKEVSLVPSFMYGHHHGVEEFEGAVGVLQATPDLAPTVITHRFSLDDAAEAFRVAGDRSTHAIKVVLHP